MQEDETTLIQVIYASAAAMSFDQDALNALLEKTRKANAERGVTGMLLHVDDSFFQVLEGEEETVDKLYAKICKDERHTDITKLIREPIEERLFGEWTMGYSQVEAEELSSIPGLNDFFSSGSCLRRLDSGRAKKLLRAFEEGRWRRGLAA